jgi:hypothetical protein
MKARSEGGDKMTDAFKITLSDDEFQVAVSELKKLAETWENNLVAYDQTVSPLTQLSAKRIAEVMHTEHSLAEQSFREGVDEIMAMSIALDMIATDTISLDAEHQGTMI